VGNAVEGELTMIRKERDRLKVVEAIREKRFKQEEAARQLNRSVRRVKRRVRACREDGVAGLARPRRATLARCNIMQALW